MNPRIQAATETKGEKKRLSYFQNSNGGHAFSALISLWSLVASSEVHLASLSPQRGEGLRVRGENVRDRSFARQGDANCASIDPVTSREKGRPIPFSPLTPSSPH
jgi:hypothetical protein